MESVHYEYETARRLAWQAVRRAIAHGVLARPEYCTECGQRPDKTPTGKSRIHAHHFAGYAPINRLDVVFVCAECHHRIHEEIESFRNKYYQEEE